MSVELILKGEVYDLQKEVIRLKQDLAKLNNMGTRIAAVTGSLELDDDGVREFYDPENVVRAVIDKWEEKPFDVLEDHI